MTAGTQRAPVRRIGDGHAEDADDTVVVEAPLELRLDGKAATVLMRTPGHDDELVRGFLLTEGLVDGAAKARAVVLARPDGLVGDERGNVIAASLPPGAPAPAERLFYASSSCGVCGKNSIAALAVRAPRVTGDVRIAAEVIAALPDKLRAAQPLFAETGGLHAAGWFDASGALVAVREDVGRHNALDKLVGWALAAGQFPLAGGVLVVSGRASYDILQKAIAAGVPVIAAVGAPSSLAVQLAEEFGVTLCGFVRPRGFNIYAGAERIAP